MAIERSSRPPCGSNRMYKSQTSTPINMLGFLHTHLVAEDSNGHAEYAAVALFCVALINVVAAIAVSKGRSARLFEAASGAGVAAACLLTLMIRGTYYPRQIISTTFIVIWGLRLSYFLYRRSLAKEVLNVGVRVAWSMLCAAPCIICNTRQVDQYRTTRMEACAVTLAGFSIALEALADQQVRREAGRYCPILRSVGRNWTFTGSTPVSTRTNSSSARNRRHFGQYRPGGGTRPQTPAAAGRYCQNGGDWGRNWHFAGSTPGSTRTISSSAPNRRHFRQYRTWGRHAPPLQCQPRRGSGGRLPPPGTNSSSAPNRRKIRQYRTQSNEHVPGRSALFDRHSRALRHVVRHSVWDL